MYKIHGQRASSWVYFIAYIYMVLSPVVETSSRSRKAHYTDSHRELHEALSYNAYSNLDDFDVVIPEIVDILGNHVSHDLHHRMRRNANEDERNFIQVTAHEHKFHVELFPNKHLLQSSFDVKIIRNSKYGTNEEQRVKDPLTNCHYEGRSVSGYSNKKTAISLCQGVTGILRSNEDFFIQPIPEGFNHSFPSPKHPHVVYKKLEARNKEEHYCGKSRTHPTPVMEDTDVEYRYLSDGEFVIQHANKSYIDNHYGQSPGSISRQRYKRGVQPRKVIETLVVADSAMLKKHKSDHIDVTTYILTVMNMVNVLFREGTLNSEIDVSLTELLLLEDDKELSLGHQASKSLSNFCQWQAKRNTTTRRRPDHAILLTGINICVDKDEPCDTLGLAEVGGMCVPEESCTINEDTGLGLAFTVAHETGHSLGMTHDGDGNTCSNRNGHVMAAKINTQNGVFVWSSCSRKALDEFLLSDQAQCLDDAQTEFYTPNFDSPRELPGQLYSATEQCKLQFGRDRIICESRYVAEKDYICVSLWCQKPTGECETKYLPASEGTPCGFHKWCRRGLCVPFGTGGPKPIDGGWSKFGPWSECSRTCGVGVSFQKRLCSNPEPVYGGRYCEGEEREYRLCNTHRCPPGLVDYRSEQCAEFNFLPYRYQYFNWIPYKQYWKYGANRCELLCEADGYKFFDRLAPRVKDGTSCDDDTKDVCVSGKCESVGCDYVLNSGAKPDICGICKGDNSTCRQVTGTFSDNVRDSGYYHVVTIPVGATTITIWEHECCTHSYIAAKSAQDPTRYYLNGNWAVDMQGEATFAGNKWRYERRISSPEILATAGPTTEDVIIEALIINKNPGISYSYYFSEIDNALPHDVKKASDFYVWREELSNCSRICAGGLQSTIITCSLNGVNPVNDSLCQEARPETETHQCNNQPCPARWQVEDWSQCSTTCGDGIQTRMVSCRQLSMSGDASVSYTLCPSPSKPRENKSCSLRECAAWKPERWSQCSRTCGRGQRTRPIFCRIGDIIVSNEECESQDRPRTKRGCKMAKCRREYQWLVAAWGECSVTCGEGVQRRKVSCTRKIRRGGFRTVKKKHCKRSKKPKTAARRRCSRGSCPLPIRKTGVNSTTTEQLTMTQPFSPPPRTEETAGVWVTGNWRKCSVTCGGGTQSRRVRCKAGEYVTHNCAPLDRPVSLRNCNTYDCPSTVVQDESCVDRFPWCYLVPYHNACGHHYFGQQCCKSCSATKGRTIFS